MFNFSKRVKYKVISNEHSRQTRDQFEELLLRKVGFGPWHTFYERVMARTIDGASFVCIPWRESRLGNAAMREIVTREDMRWAELKTVRHYRDLKEFVEENFADLL